MKLISILLPVYNSELFIKKTIDSVLNNTHKAFELIIINDGSEDNSLDIIKSYDDPRIKLYNKSNSGLIETLNYGIRKCKNEIIMRIDSDDIIHSQKIEKQLFMFKKDKVALLGTEGYTINNAGEVDSTINLPSNHDDILKAMMNYNASVIHPSIMVYKNVLQSVGLYSPYMKHAEDYDLFLRISKIGKISNLNEKLIYLRKNENNISHLNAKEQILNTFIAKKYYQDYNYKPISDKIFFKIKNDINENSLNKLYFFIHSKIVENTYLNKSKNYFTIFFMKIIRRLLRVVML